MQAARRAIREKEPAGFRKRGNGAGDTWAHVSSFMLVQVTQLAGSIGHRHHLVLPGVRRVLSITRKLSGHWSLCGGPNYLSNLSLRPELCQEQAARKKRPVSRPRRSERLESHGLVVSTHTRARGCVCVCVCGGAAWVRWYAGACVRVGSCGVRPRLCTFLMRDSPVHFRGGGFTFWMLCPAAPPSPDGAIYLVCALCLPTAS